MSAENLFVRMIAIGKPGGAFTYLAFFILKGDKLISVITYKYNSRAMSMRILEYQIYTNKVHGPTYYLSMY